MKTSHFDLNKFTVCTRYILEVHGICSHALQVFLSMGKVDYPFVFYNIYMDSRPSYGKKQVHMLVVKSIFPVPNIYIFTSAFIPVVDPEVKYILKFNTSIF